jgi:hypothetical protein
MTNKDFLIEIGKSLRLKAQSTCDQLQFMLKHADPEIWALVEQKGLKPPLMGHDWIEAMNQLRTKRAATEAEAQEIIGLHFVCFGEFVDSFLKIEFVDPIWALHNLRAQAKLMGRFDAEEV